MSSSPPLRTGLLAVLLGLITLVASASIDMYLPFMPVMAEELGSDYAAMQLTLMVFLIATGAGQLVFGPLIDAVGRRVPLLVAMVAFVLASLLASVSTSLALLIVARILQGLAAACALVTAMSTVRDVTEGPKSAQLFALLMTIQGLGPVMMPAVGGVIGSLFGWRAVFVSLMILGAVVFLTSLTGLRETLPRASRQPLRPRAILRSYGEILSDRSFLLAGLALSAAFFFIFAYVGGAAHVYQTTWGLSPRSFGFVFGGTGTAVFLGALLCARLVSRYDVQTVAFGATVLMLVGACTALAGLACGFGLAGVVTGLFLSLAGLGAAEATLMSVALATRSTAIGKAAALLGAVPLCVGALATPISAWVAKAGPAPWLLMLIALGAVTAVLAGATSRMVSRAGLRVGLQH